ncbi:hypothetical protein D3C76_222020 [compost metagenome]
MTKQVRDWQEDMKMCEKASPEPWRVEQLEYMGNRGMIQETVIDGVTSEIYNEEDARFIAEAREALPHWLQQYAAEKERADKLEERNKALMAAVTADANGTFRCVEEARAEAAETREKKLREAIEEALSWTWDCAEGNMLEVRDILTASLYPKEEEA